MELKPEVLDKLLEGVKTQEDLAGPGGLLKQITKALVERMLAGGCKTDCVSYVMLSRGEREWESIRGWRAGALF